MNKTTAFALLATVLSAPAFAQDYPPTTTQSTDTETQIKAEEALRRTVPPATTTEQPPTTAAEPAPTTSNDAAAAMTTGDASAAMQTGMAATTAAGVSTAVLTGNVVVTSRPGNSISSNYRIDFAALDRNGDSNLSHGEVNASGNDDLIREFVAVDINHNGRLSKDELKGWMD